VTVDPIRGVGQKSDNFWTRVHDRFVILLRRHSIENGIEIPLRNKESIEQRWKKKISKSVQLWNKFYRQLKSLEQCGWNEEKYIEEAGTLYLSEKGEPFKYAKCVPGVHKLPHLTRWCRSTPLNQEFSHLVTFPIAMKAILAIVTMSSKRCLLLLEAKRK